MDEIHVHKTKKSICAHFAESPCRRLSNGLLNISIWTGNEIREVTKMWRACKTSLQDLKCDIA